MTSPSRRFVVVAIGLVFASVGPAHANERYDRLIGNAKAVMLGRPAEAASVAQQAEQTAIAEPISPERTQHIAAAKWLQGEAALRQNAVTRAKPLIEAALNLLNGSAPSKLRGDLLLSRGALNSTLGRVGAALGDYQSAYKVFYSAKELRSQAIALISLGTLYQAADDNQQALNNYSRAINIYRGDPILNLSIYINRGIALKDLKEFGNAQEQFGQALTIARTLKNSAVEAQIYRNIARLKTDQNDFTGAEIAINKGFRLDSRDAPQWQSQFNALSADIAYRRGNLDIARALIMRSFAGVDLKTTDTSYREAHYTAYSVFTKLNDWPNAVLHLQAMKRLDDQVFKLTASANTALMAARFDSANQETRIATLKADDLARKVALEQTQARFQRILFGSIGAAALTVMGLLGFGLYQSRRARTKLSTSNAALEKALAAKTEFLATTSHEIRTPLNGILGMTQVMLADAGLDAVVRDRVGIVHGAGLTMRALVDDILDVAKMEAGRLTIDAAPFDLRAMLEDVTRIWAEHARAKDLAFVLDVGDCPRGMIGDAGRLRQVVYNLLANAVKFTATGTVTVRSGCGGDRLLITVADTGIGIADDKHDEIFESFRQADGRTTRTYGGTGLGLAICRNIAHAMAGTIRVASAPGQGSAFTLDVPFVAAEAAPHEPEHQAGAWLVVDPNPIGRAVVKAVIEARGTPVRFAASCAAARAALADGGIDRLVVDEAALRAEGPDPVQAVAALVAAGHPVAVLWSRPDAAIEAALTAAGVAAVIAKPIAGPALAARLFDPVQTALVSQAA